MSISLELSFEDSGVYNSDIVRTATSQICDIVEYQLKEYFIVRPNYKNRKIDIICYTPFGLEKHIKFHAKFLKWDDVQILKDEIDHFIVHLPFDSEPFTCLAGAEVEIEPGVEFPVPLFDIHKIRPEEFAGIRNYILDLYSLGLEKLIAAGHIESFDFKDIIESVRSETWFVEKEIGEIVRPRWDKAIGVQLVTRWEPDYMYHIARIHRAGEEPVDHTFMIYWRLLSERLLERPGRLIWKKKNTLKFISSYWDDYKFLMNIDRFPIDFSYYLEPPRHRGTTFCTHLVDAAEEAGTNVIELN